ncbi:hypothetical protein NQZ68_028808 [Dissostichus eleginoides]|nr:hypothetical protein NQZ68_028808 [Dissostichus eleginoides]
MEGRTDLYRLETSTLTAISSEKMTEVRTSVTSMVDTALPQTVQELSDALVQIWEEIP